MAGAIPVSPGIINGPLYKIAHFATGYLNVPPNMHRMFNAFGLTGGILGGRYSMNVLTASTPNGEKVDIKDVPFFLRPVYGVMAYDHYSDDPIDRWKKVADMTIPAITGGLGAGVGSDYFFKDALKKVTTTISTATKNTKAFTLADAESQSLYHQGRAWGDFSKLSSVFGSSSGFGGFPSPLNYSSTLGSKFTLDAGRAAVSPWLGKGLRASLLNSHSLEPFRPIKLLDSAIAHLASNPSAHPENAIAALEGVVKTWFNDATPQQIEKFTGNVLEKRAGIKGGEAEVKKQLGEFLDFKNGAFERRLIEAGIDPRSAQIGDTGIGTTFARWGGALLGKNTMGKIHETQALMIKGLEERHPDLIAKFGEAKPADLTKSSTAAKTAMAAFAATGAATVAAIGLAKDSEVADLAKPATDSAQPATPQADASAEGGPDRITKEFSKGMGPGNHKLHSKKNHDFINGSTLDTAEGITGMFSSGIGMHRIHCAIGLTVGSWIGDEVMKALTGVTFAGEAIKKEEVWEPLQKIFKTLAFNPHSDLPKDKWMQVMRWGVPGIVGGLAVVQGSKMFFKEREHKLRKATYLDEVEGKATMAQSQPWSYTSSISALFGYPSGLGMLPLVNYSTNLGTRFMMASDRKVSMPGLGKLWSNNPTLFPYGPPGMINMLIKDVVNNKSYNPEMLETEAIGVLKPWFDNITPKNVEDFAVKVYEIRDKFYQDGGVPEELKAQLEAELKAHLKGAGLEDTLRDIGLDPLNATIGNNGFSGKIAESMGAKKSLDKIKSDYAASYVERMQNRQNQPPGLSMASVGE